MSGLPPVTRPRKKKTILTSITDRLYQYDKKENRDETNDEDNTFIIRLIYILSTIVWILLIVYLELMCTNNIFSKLILIYPFLFNIINMVFVTNDLPNTDIEAVRANVLTFYFIASGLIINWSLVKCTNTNKQLKNKILIIFVTSLMLLFLSIGQIWSIIRNPVIEFHIDAALNTMAITLLGYTILEFLGN